MSVVSPDMRQGWLDFRQGRGLDRRRRQRQEQAVRDLSARRPALYRPRQRAGAVGQEAQDDRQQRVVRNHPHAQFGVRRLHQCAHRLLSASLARRDRRHQRSGLSEHQQRRLSRRLRHHAGGLRSRPSAMCSTRSTRSSRRLSQQRYLAGTPITEADWRLFSTLIRFDAVYYCALQVQLAAHLRISEPVELSARSLSGSRAWPRPSASSRSSGTITAASGR